MRRFQREARTAGRLQHTNIVPVYALGNEGGVWYYAMELIEGSSLSQVLKALRGIGESPGTGHETILSGQALDLEAADASGDEAPDADAGRGRDPRRGTGLLPASSGKFADVADALASAHDEGVIHRDMKPSNLMLDARGS